MNYTKNVVKTKLLDPNAHVPTRGSAGAAGYDLYALEREVIHSGECVKCRTGIAVQIPCGHFGAVFARSGLSIKQGLRPGNCVGVIDSDYTGEVIVALYNDSGISKEVKAGDRIAQLVIIPYQVACFEVVDNLNETDRGDGGFGSTGR